MATIWNSDGSTQVSAGTGRGWGGGHQTHSIFGWADEKAEKAVTETRAQADRTWNSKPDMKEAAGVATKTSGEMDTGRKVAEHKIKDIQGHNIFNPDGEGESFATGWGVTISAQVRQSTGQWAVLLSHRDLP